MVEYHSVPVALIYCICLTCNVYVSPIAIQYPPKMIVSMQVPWMGPETQVMVAELQSAIT